MGSEQHNTVKPFQIGQVHLVNPWILAPMAGVSEWPYRVIATEHGASAAPTELVSARAMVEGTARSERYLAWDREREPVFWVQLFGADPVMLSEASCAAVERGATLIDFNMGCPVRKVTKSGAGSALLSDPRRAGQLVEALAAGGVPVTVKIRAGWDENHLTFCELAKCCAEAGAAAIAMHARTRAQGYAGRARWEWIRQLVDCSPIPVIGNGDVFSRADAHRMLRTTGCAAVMVGRGALGNPWIFSELRGSGGAPSARDRVAVVLQHFDSNREHIGADLEAVRRFRKHAIWYATGLNSEKRLLPQFLRCDDVDEARAMLDTFFRAATPCAYPRTVEFEEKRALG